MRDQSRLACALPGRGIIIAHSSKMVADLLASEGDSLVIGRGAWKKILAMRPTTALSSRSAIEKSAAASIGGTSKREVV